MQRERQGDNPIMQRRNIIELGTRIEEQKADRMAKHAKLLASAGSKKRPNLKKSSICEERRLSWGLDDTEKKPFEDLNSNRDDKDKGPKVGYKLPVIQKQSL